MSWYIHYKLTENMFGKVFVSCDFEHWCKVNVKVKWWATDVLLFKIKTNRAIQFSNNNYQFDTEEMK